MVIDAAFVFVFVFDQMSYFYSQKGLKVQQYLLLYLSQFGWQYLYLVFYQTSKAKFRSQIKEEDPKLYSQEALPVWTAEADAEVRPILRQQPQILHHYWEQPPGNINGDGDFSTAGDGDDFANSSHR